MSPTELFFIILASSQVAVVVYCSDSVGSRCRRESQQYNQSLQFYDASSKCDLYLVKRWYHLIEALRPLMTNDTEALSHLRREVSARDKLPSSMKSAFDSAIIFYKTLSALTRSENIAVSMYTGSFYFEYNKASSAGNWTQYKFYTYLLLSAVKKLAVLHPISPNETLYRGLPGKFNKPKAARIFWKTFTSTSLSKDVSYRFGKGAVIRFEPLASRFGARIQNLSLFHHEEEVLLLPFESYDFLRQENQTLVFRVSKRQELLDPQPISFRSMVRTKASVL